MKSRVVRNYCPWFLVLVWLTPSVFAANQPAQVRLYCQSLQFQPATTRVAGQTYTLEITTADSFSEINGELAPLYSPNLPTHGALFRLQSPVALEPILGNIAFDQPEPVDLNENGFDDFFEVRQEGDGTAQGLFETPIDSGSVSVTWRRGAGSVTGTCQVRLTSSTFGQYPTFTHTFQLLEFKGTLSYVPSTNLITGTLKVARTGQEANLLSGATAMTRVATNRFNQVLLLPGSLVGAEGQVLLYAGTGLERDELTKTNYFGYFAMADGDLKTAATDYLDWVLSIDDPNDANGNGIPDLTDDLAAAGARRPVLRLARSANQLLLNISGDIGSRLDLETLGSLSAANWSRSLSVTLTNDPHVVVLPLPESAAQFWRGRGP
ncbi:MAG: hypothetical protein FJ398_13245 [Verrucomicrobia bacterium]|nr:hypothetical protein [Verrucomicrobiota bacterium]